MDNNVCVIGGGNVGTTILYGLAISNIKMNLFLIDNHRKRGYANCLDINNCLGNQVKIINYKAIKNMNYIIIAVGIKNSKKRNIFLKNSYEMIKEIIDNINKNCFKGKIIVVSNPNDVITTYVSSHYNGIVIGTGTSLDNKRLKTYLGEKYDGSFIVGEHGNSQVLIGNTKVKHEIVKYASKIINGKHYTNYGVSSCVCDILENLILNTGETMIVSTFDKKQMVSYSLPLKIINNKIMKFDACLKNKQQDLYKSINKIKKEYELFCTPKIIGIDLDDTITVLQKYMKEEAKKFDDEINGNGIINEKAYLVGEMYNWTDVIKEKFFNERRKIAIEKAELRKNAKNVLNGFIDKGYDVIIITARSDLYYDDAYGYTKSWLDKKGIRYSKLIINAKDKKKICKKYKIDYFIDDMPNNCVSVESLKSVVVMMMKNGNNKVESKEIFTVKNFREIMEVVKNG